MELVGNFGKGFSPLRKKIIRDERIEFSQLKEEDFYKCINAFKNCKELQQEGTQEDFERFMKFSDSEIPIEEVFVKK